MESQIYKCANCSKVYKNISSLKKHIIAFHTAKPNQAADIPNTKPKKAKIGRPKLNKCITCNKEYSSKYTLERHINSNICKKHTITTTVDNSVLQSLTDVLLKLADGKQVNYTNSGIVLNGCSNVMMAEHIGNTENNNLYIRDIHINPIGKESLSHISDADILRILCQGTNAVPALAKAIMERPENCNIVESDKRNKKATVVNRDGDIEIMDLNKALTMCATETVDKVDDYYEKFKNDLPKQNKSIQRMARAHGLESDEDEDEIPKDESYDAYFTKYMSQIKDNIDVNKKPILERINKYKEHKYKEKTNKQDLPALTS
jgi:hypothetical protein